MGTYFEEQDALAESKELENEWEEAKDSYHETQNAIAERGSRKQDTDAWVVKRVSGDDMEGSTVIAKWFYCSEACLASDGPIAGPTWTGSELPEKGTLCERCDNPIDWWD